MAADNSSFEEGCGGQWRGGSVVATRILVVEDNPVSQKILHELLKLKGHDCDIVSTGAQALRSVHEHSYALVFMDLRIPNMDGFTAAQAIRQMGNTMPIIALTAEQGDADIQKALEVGMNGYLTKPFRTSDFDMILKRWL